MPTRPAAIIRRLLGPARSAGADDTSDSELLARFTGTRDPAAFERLARRHAGLVWHVCRNVLGHEQDSEDAFQATFLVLARRAAAVRQAGSVAAFLHGVALRVSLRARRTAARRRAVPHEPAGQTPDPAADAAFRDLQVTLAEEVDRLPAKLRGPFVLCVLEGASRADAARALGLNAGTLSTRLAAARVRLRERLGRRGVLFAAAIAALHVAPIAPAGELARLVQSAVTTMGHPNATASALAHWLGAQPSWSKLIGVVATLGALSVAATLISPAQSQPGREDPPPTAHHATDPAISEGVGDPLPAGAVRRLGAQRFRIAGRLGFALPTPDGKYALVQPEPAISGSPAHGLFLMDLESGLIVRTFEYGHRVLKPQDYQAVRPAAFSPDGTKLYGLALPRDANPNDHDQLDYWGSFDLRQKRVLAAWDVSTGRRTNEWPLPAGDGAGESLLGVNVSPDGKRLYVWGAIRMRADIQRSLRGVPGVHVLDSETGAVVDTWDGAGHVIGVTAGKELITFRRDAEVTAVDAKTGKAVRTYSLAGYIPSVAVSPDGKLLAAVAVTGEGTKRTSSVRVWECATGREIVRADTTPLRVGSKARLAFAADGAVLFLGTSAGDILRWDLATGKQLPAWPGHTGTIGELFVRPGTKELISIGAYDGAVRRREVETGKAVPGSGAYTGEVAFAQSPDRRSLVAVDETGRLDVWDLATGQVTKTIATKGRKVHQLTFTPDGRQLLIAAQEGPNSVWDLAAGKQVAEFTPPPKKDPKADEYWWNSLAFSPDGRLLAASKFGRGTWMWTWPGRDLLWHEAQELGCHFTPDGKSLITAGWYRDLEFRDPTTGTVRRTLTGTEVGVTDFAASPDGRRIATSDVKGPFAVRDPATGAALKEIRGATRTWSVAFSPSGWLLAVAGDKSVRIFDTASWQEVTRLDGHVGYVRSVYFGADDATVVSASGEDGTALVWSLRPPPTKDAPVATRLWADLAGDGPAAWRAVWSAAAHADVAIRLFREKWPPPKEPFDPKRVAALIADLDSARFAAREAAVAELTKLGRRAEGQIREAAKSGSAEARQRAETIIATWSAPLTAEVSAEDAREMRAVWALELAGTPAARDLLREWADGRVGRRLWEEAEAAGKRIATRP